VGRHLLARRWSGRLPGGVRIWRAGRPVRSGVRRHSGLVVVLAVEHAGCQPRTSSQIRSRVSRLMVPAASASPAGAVGGPASG
jgi:hypothetical protein